MPTLIRIVVFLLVLVGLAYGAMFGLVAMVNPPDKEVTLRIPARDLLPSVERDPLVQREIDTSRPIEPNPPAVDPPPAETPAAPAAESPAAEAPAASAPAATEDGSIVTLAPGVE